MIEYRILDSHDRCYGMLGIENLTDHHSMRCCTETANEALVVREAVRRVLVFTPVPDGGENDKR